MSTRIIVFCIVSFLTASSSVAAEMAPPLPKSACAAWDVHITTLIDDHGMLGDTELDLLIDAGSMLQSARASCRDGDVRGGLAQYESIQLGHVRPAFLADVWWHR